MVISGETPSSIIMGTTTGAIALHLAEAEPMTRSRPDDMPSKDTSSSGLGMDRAVSASAPRTASTGPRFDQENMATKWAAKKASTI